MRQANSICRFGARGQNRAFILGGRILRLSFTDSRSSKSHSYFQRSGFSERLESVPRCQAHLFRATSYLRDFGPIFAKYFRYAANRSGTTR
jgi:hypothetical protein